MYATPNFFAYIALLSWPFVALLLYKFRPPAEATIWTILGGFLLLPVGVEIKIPMIPQFDKNSIPNICAVIGCMAVARRDGARGPGFGWFEILIAIYIVSPVVTSWLNPDPIVIDQLVLPGVGLYDGISAAIGEFMFFLSFLIGRRYLRSAADHEQVLRALAIAGLAYSLPMLFEMRMSPQLHNWIYGFQPSEFLQSVREDGYRPMVFTGHGLIAAFFLMASVVAATTLWRLKIRAVNLPPPAIVTYLAVIQVLCKSAAALTYAILLTPLVRFASARLQLRIAVLLVAVGLTFPLLRMMDLFPTTTLVETASVFGQERADSLQFRFDHEQALLQRANERFWFGWGRYGRSRIYDEYGNDRSVTDGYWVITEGQYGFVGFAVTFLLLTLPVFRAASALRYAGSLREGLLLAALGLIVAIGVIDLLPNSSVRPWTLLVAGALYGKAELLLAERGRSRNPNPARVANARVGPLRQS
jgi:hypothetical protein